MSTDAEVVDQLPAVIPDEFKPLLSEVLGMGRRLADYPSLAEGAIVKQGIENAFQAVTRARGLLEKRIITDRIEQRQVDIAKINKEITILKERLGEW